MNDVAHRQYGMLGGQKLQCLTGGYRLQVQVSFQILRQIDAEIESVKLKKIVDDYLGGI